ALGAPGDIGFRDQSYAPLGGSPTGSKPESKLWFNNGWWATMFNPTAGEHRIYKLNTATGTWSDTGVAIDPRDSTRADTLWDAGTNKLYVASHVYTTSGAATTSGNAGRLYRFSYNAGTGRYSLDAGFPVTVNAAKTETLVIDKDSTGTLWATWTQGSRVYVNHTVSGNDAVWGTPYIVPGAGTSLTSDDISSLIRFGGNKIGVMWSNQVDHHVYFSIHADGTGDAAAAWSTSVVPTGGATSDDHINLKADSAGRVYAAVKTSDTGSKPLILLLIRSAAGSWSRAVFGLGSNSHTRPIVELDVDHSVLHVFATCPQPPKTSGQSGGDICEKTGPMGDSTSFSPGIGTAVIRDAGSPDMNDATSTKQNLGAATGLVVMANNATSKLYWHMQESLGGAPPPLAAGFTGAPTSGTAPLDVAFTDSSTGSPTSWSWDFGDGGTSTAQSPTHTYAAAGTYTVKLTVSDGTSSDTLTRTGYIVVSPQGGGGGGQQVFTPIADAQVKSTSPGTNYGTLSSLRLREGTSPTDVFYHSYLTFTVSGLSGPVTGAKLRLFVTDASPDGGSVFGVDPTAWTESTLTWNNAPPLAGTPIASVGATSATGAWTEVSLDSLVGGNGTYSIGLSSASSNSAIYDSREGTNSPQLVVTTG
ncbi:MAG: CBM96 family carbohydrate-binding protein, partial [Solirubrobacteraceae bacterium]